MSEKGKAGSESRDWIAGGGRQERCPAQTHRTVEEAESWEVCTPSSCRMPSTARSTVCEEASRDEPDPHHRAGAQTGICYHGAVHGEGLVTGWGGWQSHLRLHRWESGRGKVGAAHRHVPLPAECSRGQGGRWYRLWRRWGWVQNPRKGRASTDTLHPCRKRLRDGGVSKGASGRGLSTHGPSTPGMQGLGAANCDTSSAAAVTGQHGLGLRRTRPSGSRAGVSAGWVRPGATALQDGSSSNAPVAQTLHGCGPQRSLPVI